jgi:hypothetical protein
MIKSQADESPAPSSLVVLLNLSDELKRLAPPSNH